MNIIVWLLWKSEPLSTKKLNKLLRKVKAIYVVKPGFSNELKEINTNQS